MDIFLLGRNDILYYFQDIMWTSNWMYVHYTRNL